MPEETCKLLQKNGDHACTAFCSLALLKKKTICWQKQTHTRAGKMTQCLKRLLAKPDVSSVPGIHMEVEGENQLQSCLLISTEMLQRSLPFSPSHHPPHTHIIFFFKSKAPMFSKTGCYTREKKLYLAIELSGWNECWTINTWVFGPLGPPKMKCEVPAFKAVHCLLLGLTLGPPWDFGRTC